MTVGQDPQPEALHKYGIGSVIGVWVVAGIVGFHVASKFHDVGAIVRLKGTSKYVAGRISQDAHFGVVESAIDGERPEAAPSRYCSVFAHDSLGACAAFWDAEMRFGGPEYGSRPRYYRVAMSSALRAPSCLAARISLRLQQGLPVGEIAREHWSPRHAWRCGEYLAAEFEVLGQVAPPTRDELLQFLANQQSDLEMAQRLWPIRMKMKSGLEYEPYGDAELK